MKHAVRLPLIASILFHVLIVALFTAGLPFFRKEPPVLLAPVPVEIVQDKAQTKKTKKPVKKAVKKPSPKKPAPPAVTKPKAPEVKQKSVPPLKQKKPPKSLEDLNLKKPEQPKPKAENKDFSALLKNLMPDERVAEETVEEKTSLDDLAQRLTSQEIDGIRRQIEPCWNVPAGVKYAEDLVVELKIKMNADRTVRSVSLLDSGRYNRDSAYRAAADAARRAVRNPRCQPFKLPPDKYEQWKDIVIRFDPRGIL